MGGRRAEADRHVGVIPHLTCGGGERPTQVPLMALKHLPMSTLYLVAAIVVLTVWAVIALVNTITGDYTGLTLVMPVMMVLAGALFVIRRNGKP